MKQYRNDYNKVIKAESMLIEAESFLVNECYDEVALRIIGARQLLREYLSQDNMVEVNDLADGWVKASDAKKLEDALDYLL